ncbi:bile acid:sodium symporter family protein [Arsenicicoccus sp. oral taxon 190]|uniref:bile acid:sodium symporter family protein n=1 Tax=Arsenicicoccus sp. oral taxon 190 TaxID=1658671 RepID=UPI00067A2092|nr:bile acid:sodium symporter family protein [Arsenicicoccus sp. oral taxon 190]AKT51531.1 membrane protein [Arsenicicoccus sp. oral taxon 190]
MLSRLRLDPFLLAIICAALVASVLPARGSAVPVVDAVVAAAIFLLFFLYGARLAPHEAVAGLKHWRLHGVILAFTFVVFPLVGMLALPGLRAALGGDLASGLLYVCLVPSTVQSSIAFTSIARGNVAGAIVSASVSNLVGVVLTPLLVVALMTTTGTVEVTGSAFVDILVQLLLPFVLGQVAGHWIRGWVKAHAAPLKLVDRGSIVLVVYSAFSAGMREGIWSRVTLPQLGGVLVVCLLLLAALLWLTRAVAQRLGFGRGDVIAIQFCGTKKSLASGLPMAMVLFAGQPVGLMVLPLMVFHQAQLMACSALAARYGREADAVGDAADGVGRVA